MPPAPSAKELFLAASEVADVAERGRFLDEACAGDAALRAKVDTLLVASTPEDFLAAPPLAAEAVMDETLPVLGSSIGYFGDYLLLSEIARGSTGVVFRARQTSLQRIVALKMLRDRSHLASPADEARFRAEAAAAAALDHPGIVPIHDIGQHEGQGYYSMKFIAGGTLDFRRAEFREPRRAVDLIARVARAVHHAHQHGILHRDLKPGNILLTREGEPLVTDFGIARQLGVESGLTHTGQIIGTPHYMAPEQARGENRTLTPAADIYSLGAILYELLAGRKPFEGDSMLTLLKQVTEQAPPPLAADRELAGMVHRCLEKRPGDRYGSAEQLADDLERWLRGEKAAGIPQAGRWRGAAVAAAVVFLAGAAWLSREAWLPKPAAIAIQLSEVPISEPASPARLANADPLAARQALEWLHRVNGPHGYVTVLSPGGKELHLRVGEALPPGDFVITGLWLDRYRAAADLTPVRPAEFRHHAATLRHLKWLMLRQLPLTADDLTFLALNPALTDLRVGSLPAGDRLLPHIANLKGLRHLEISENKGLGEEFTGHGLDTLACLPTLEVAQFQNTHFEDIGVAHLVKAARKLRILHLDSTRITDAALRDLSHRALDTIGLSNNPTLTDEGLAALAEIPALRELWANSSPFSKAAMEAFLKARPECRLIR